MALPAVLIYFTPIILPILEDSCSIYFSSKIHFFSRFLRVLPDFCCMMIVFLSVRHSSTVILCLDWSDLVLLLEIINWVAYMLKTSSTFWHIYSLCLSICFNQPTNHHQFLISLSSKSACGYNRSLHPNFDSFFSLWMLLQRIRYFPITTTAFFMVLFVILIECVCYYLLRLDWPLKFLIYWEEV